MVYIDQNVLSIAYQAGTNWQLTYKYIYYNIYVPKVLLLCTVYMYISKDKCVTTKEAPSRIVYITMVHV